MENFGIASPACTEFRGANTCRGFCGYYGEMIASFYERHKEGAVYVIKGGPGTGKSTFMKKTAALLAEAGCEVCLIRCSGDPKSLDGVYSESAGIMVIDGTAPHCTEAHIAGVSGEILNFGQFWDRERLLARREEIENSLARKQLAYDAAYGYLAAAREMQRVAEKIASRRIDGNILDASVESVLTETAERYGSTGKRGTAENLFATAVTADGISGSPEAVLGDEVGSYRRYVFHLPPWVHLGKEMQYMADRLMRLGYSLKLCRCGFHAEIIEHIVVPEIRCAFLSTNEYHDAGQSAPACEYFVESMSRGRPYSVDERDTLLQCRLKFDEMLIKTQYALKDAAEVHKKIEDCYVDSMDFDALNGYCGEMLEKIRSIL